ncbi:hypothetical protein AaE_015488 [Aphanomyces astaci]|uniref:BRO1 domain-containing protein n=1 Tax=Aphanomyces astaci TaxID=112090 RepID=A0A6A4YVU7_APHAT|nr:hypothetical protein AaE_015488 [Aphanomyces astaci]
MSLKEVLRPACDGLSLGIKFTKPVNFSVEKTLFANVAPAILDALTAARSKLLCECKDFKKPTQNQWDVEKSFFQTDAYFQSASEYLSLVKGFTEQPPVVDTPADDQEGLLSNDTLVPSVPFTCCEWMDVSSTTFVHSLNAHHEYAHTLFAIGCVGLQRANDLTQVMLRSRDFEFDEPKLKEAYNLLLRVAGVFDAVLSWLGTASTTSTELGEDSLAQWRAEQTRAGNSDIQSLQRVKDFESGVVSKALNVVALAQAQELVLLRGVTKDVVDWVLMGKLAMDISRRYAELNPPARFASWCAWKHAYYVGLSSYYQGMAEWVKNDGPGCAQAVAQFKSAKEQLANLQNKEVERSKTIIDRDLEIATARNLAVYLEKVPAPCAPLDPVSLVQVQPFHPGKQLQLSWGFYPRL